MSGMTGQGELALADLTYTVSLELPLRSFAGFCMTIHALFPELIPKSFSLFRPKPKKYIIHFTSVSKTPFVRPK